MDARRAVAEGRWAGDEEDEDVVGVEGDGSADVDAEWIGEGEAGGGESTDDDVISVVRFVDER